MAILICSPGICLPLQAFPAFYNRFPGHPMWQRHAFKRWLDDGLAHQWIRVHAGLMKQLRESAASLSFGLSLNGHRSSNVVIGNLFMNKKVDIQLSSRFLIQALTTPLYMWRPSSTR